MTREVLVYAEVHGREVDRCTLEILGRAREIADSMGASLSTLILGDGISDQVGLLSSTGVDKVLVMQHSLLNYYNPDSYTSAIAQMVTERKPALFLLGYTHAGMEIGPSIAVRINATLASNCVDIRMVEGKILLVRSMYQGKISAKVDVEDSTPIVVSVQKGALPLKQLAPRPTEIERIEPKLEEQHLRTKASSMLEAIRGEVDITKADIIVAVGRGIRDKQNIPLIRGFAEAVGGMVACTRPLVDLGWLPQELQVGMSAKSVRPNVYIAVGISGASQHIVGMRDSKMIIAINKDPSAPIFRIADYGIVDDLFKILPALADEARKLKQVQ